MPVHRVHHRASGCLTQYITTSPRGAPSHLLPRMHRPNWQYFSTSTRRAYRQYFTTSIRLSEASFKNSGLDLVSQVAQRELVEYTALGQGGGLHAHEEGMERVCDRCLQAIDEGQYRDNLARLQQEVGELGWRPAYGHDFERAHFKVHKCPLVL